MKKQRNTVREKRQLSCTSIYLLQFYTSLKIRFHKEFWNAGFTSFGFHNKTMEPFNKWEVPGFKTKLKAGLCFQKVWAPHVKNTSGVPSPFFIAHISVSRSHECQPVSTGSTIKHVAHTCESSPCSVPPSEINLSFNWQCHCPVPGREYRTLPKRN